MWLDDTQLDSICTGITRQQRARRVKYLRALGLSVKEKPNGDPLVLCSNVEAVLGGLPTVGQNRATPADVQPDRAALIARFSKPKKALNGPSPQK